MKDYLDALNTALLPEAVRSVANQAAVSLVAGLQCKGLWPRIGHDLADVAAVLARHHAKPRLFELANPRFQTGADPSNTFVLMLEREGRPVACGACRLKLLPGTLKAAFEDQSLLFDDTAMIPATSGFVVRHPIAEQIRAQHIAMTTGICNLLDYDRELSRGLFKTLVRLLHLRAFTVWPQWDHLVAICAPEFAAKYPLDVEGYTTIGSRFWWRRDGEWKRYRLVVAEREHWRDIVASPRLADLSVPLGEPAL